MITLDILARELGCTLEDLREFATFPSHSSGTEFVTDNAAEGIRAEWSKKTGINYTETVQ
ncbi:hypothetical protein D3I60_00080 [Brevibacterium permense]|uniref:hypothetical protein n=1 Tax=Brevibacterium permense TaxID=234834 RepID=UPI0021CFF1C7|nr:hypothetical protein [Brevibacterium permense]MCU4295494.1 hypothetical protein [Brevibacterium permense]